MIYLASPYSHPDSAVREHRYQEAVRATAELIEEGKHVFCPVVQGHPLADYGIPTDWSFWEEHAKDHLSRCDELWVLMLPGWRESVGVRAEERIARELGKPVSLRPPQPEPEELAQVAKESVR